MKFPTLPRDQVRLYPELATGLWKVDVQLCRNGPWHEYTREPTREGAEESYKVLTGELKPRGIRAIAARPNARTTRRPSPRDWR